MENPLGVVRCSADLTAKGLGVVAVTSSGWRWSVRGFGPAVPDGGQAIAVMAQVPR